MFFLQHITRTKALKIQMLPVTISVQSKRVHVYFSGPKCKWLCGGNGKSSDVITCLQPWKKTLDHSALLRCQCFSARAFSKLYWVFTAAQYKCLWMAPFEKILAEPSKINILKTWKMWNTLQYRLQKLLLGEMAFWIKTQDRIWTLPKFRPFPPDLRPICAKCFTKIHTVVFE